MIRDGNVSRVAFVTYFKGEYGLHTLIPKEAKATVASRDFGEPGPIIDFQAPLTHTLVQANQKKKGPFEKMFLDGRPPLNVGVTSGGDLFGGTQISFADVLGDKQFNFYVASVSQYRTIAGSYLNLSRRMQYAIQGFQQTTFFYGNADYYALSLGLTPFLDRDNSIATRTLHRRHDVRAVSAQPLHAPRDVGRRGALQRAVRRSDRRGDLAPEPGAVLRHGDPARGHVRPARHRDCPRGHGLPRVRSSLRQHGAAGLRRLAPHGDTLSYQTLDSDARKYLRIGTSGLFAMRFKGFRSWGRTPDFFYFGGNSSCGATITCRSSASRASSSTPSSASR